MKLPRCPKSFILQQSGLCSLIQQLQVHSLSVSTCHQLTGTQNSESRCTPSAEGFSTFAQHLMIICITSDENTLYRERDTRVHAPGIMFGAQIIPPWCTSRIGPSRGHLQGDIDIAGGAPEATLKRVSKTGIPIP